MATEDVVLFVYRSLPPHHHDRPVDRPKPGAFHLRKSEVSLSVFVAERVTPRMLLQDYLDRVQADADSGEEERVERARRRFDANGRTPDEMYEKGWRVARLPASCFEVLGLRLGPPRASDGHCDVEADSREAFEVAAAALRDVSTILDRAETLAKT